MRFLALSFSDLSIVNVEDWIRLELKKKKRQTKDRIMEENPVH